MPDVLIVAARRTAIGRFQGAFATTPAADLGATVLRALLADSGVEPAAIDRVILGHVLTAAAGQNTARQATLRAGLPVETPATTVNMVCGSGLEAVQLAAQAIRTGDADLVLAGGMENMSLAPYCLPKARNGLKMGHASLVDTMITDGLWDAFGDCHMGITAENLARKHGITRDESVCVTVPDLVIFFEPRDLIHVRRIEHIGLQQTHPVLDRMAVLLFNRREIALRPLNFFSNARDSLCAREKQPKVIEIGFHAGLGLFGLAFGKHSKLGESCPSGFSARFEIDLDDVVLARQVTRREFDRILRVIQRVHESRILNHLAVFAEKVSNKPVLGNIDTDCPPTAHAGLGHCGPRQDAQRGRRIPLFERRRIGPRDPHCVNRRREFPFDGVQKIRNFCCRRRGLNR